MEKINFTWNNFRNQMKPTIIKWNIKNIMWSSEIGNWAWFLANSHKKCPASYKDRPNSSFARLFSGFQHPEINRSWNSDLSLNQLEGIMLTFSDSSPTYSLVDKLCSHFWCIILFAHECLNICNPGIELILTQEW